MRYDNLTDYSFLSSLTVTDTWNTHLELLVSKLEIFMKFLR